MTEPKPRRFTAEQIRDMADTAAYWTDMGTGTIDSGSISAFIFKLEPILEQAASDAETLQSIQDAAAACGFTDAESQAHPEQVIRTLAETVGEREAELEWIYTNWPELREAVRIGRAPLAINPGSS